MFKISKGSLYGRYNIEGFVYMVETNSYMSYMEASNIDEDLVALLLLDRTTGEEHNIEWALDIARLTNCTAVIGDDGEIKAIPVTGKREDHVRHEERSNTTLFHPKRAGHTH